MLYKGRYCIMFLHLHYTIKSLVVTTCNSWGFRAILNNHPTCDHVNGNFFNQNK